jgi:hypothetical protein
MLLLGIVLTLEHLLHFNLLRFSEFSFLTLIVLVVPVLSLDDFLELGLDFTAALTAFTGVTSFAEHLPLRILSPTFLLSILIFGP